MNGAAALEHLRKTIIETVLVQGTAEDISDGMGELNVHGWLFDFRRVIMQGRTIEAIGEACVNTFKDLPHYQICGLEVAAIPLVTGITQYRYMHGVSDANGFFIRKSRKKEGLLRMIEGTILPNTPIILVDDIMNQGKSLMRQIEVLEGLGHRVHAVWTILRYRDVAFYEHLHKRNIQIHSLFSLDELTHDTDIKNLLARPDVPRMRNEYRALWKFESKRPNYFWVVPKSTPLLHSGIVYFGADNGTFWAINAHDGSVVWSYKVGTGSRGKSIFSSPALYNGIIYFGAYDGNVYALDAATGAKKWIYFDADWVGSSPAVAPDLGLVFVGLEFGLLKKRGGVVALNLLTGEKVWWDPTMPNLTHATPLYISHAQQVAIGSNDGILRLYGGKTGNLIWKAKTGDPNPVHLRSGFSPFDIKSYPVHDLNTDSLTVANADGDVYNIDRTSGSYRWHARMEFGSYGAPLLFQNTVYIGSMDKHVYAFSVESGKLLWKTKLGARIFATPIVVEGLITIGCNDGKIYSISPNDGKISGHTTLTERITNAGVYDQTEKILYITTYANELYALKKEVQ
jgi:outer membrane protein assembly factor BamB/orotate phosphoribosyltransferase